MPWGQGSLCGAGQQRPEESYPVTPEAETGPILRPEAWLTDSRIRCLSFDQKGILIEALALLYSDRRGDEINIRDLPRLGDQFAGASLATVISTLVPLFDLDGPDHAYLLDPDTSGMGRSGPFPISLPWTAAELGGEGE